MQFTEFVPVLYIWIIRLFALTTTTLLVFLLCLKGTPKNKTLPKKEKEPAKNKNVEEKKNLSAEKDGDYEDVSIDQEEAEKGSPGNQKLSTPKDKRVLMKEDRTPKSSPMIESKPKEVSPPKPVPEVIKLVTKPDLIEKSTSSKPAVPARSPNMLPEPKKAVSLPSAASLTPAALNPSQPTQLTPGCSQPNVFAPTLPTGPAPATLEKPGTPAPATQLVPEKLDKPNPTAPPTAIPVKPPGAAGKTPETKPGSVPKDPEAAPTPENGQTKPGAPAVLVPAALKPTAVPGTPIVPKLLTPAAFQPQTKPEVKGKPNAAVPAPPRVGSKPVPVIETGASGAAMGTMATAADLAKIVVEPLTLTWGPPFAGSMPIKIVNNTKFAIGFKTKTSNNDIYSLVPVFGKLVPGATTYVQIQRKAGDFKDDKIIIMFASIPEGTDVATHFKNPALVTHNCTVYSVKK